MPSGGVSITRSSAVRPVAISTSLPRSRAIVTGLSTTRSSGPTVATRIPPWSKISALAGTWIAASGFGSARLHVGERAGHQRAVGVVDDKLHPRRAGRDVDRLRRSFDRRREGLAGIFRHRDLRLGADLDARHVVLRHVDVGAQPRRVRHDEQRRPAAEPALISAPTSVVRDGDEAVERRDDALVLLQHLQRDRDSPARISAGPAGLAESADALVERPASTPRPT